MPTRIEWTNETWNPTTGCTRVSPGCRHCYAERMAPRLAGRFGYPPAPDQFKPTLHPDKLDLPYTWKKPRRIFVDSMSDLFHPDIPFDFVDRVWYTMSACYQHTFQILTKRPARLREFILDRRPNILPNVWLGVSCEDQTRADQRIPLLLETPAAFRFVSLEPLLGYVDLSVYLYPGFANNGRCLDWVILGGETGPDAREMNPAWERAVRQSCHNARVPYFFKRWGSFYSRAETAILDHDYPTLRQYPGDPL